MAISNHRMEACVNGQVQVSYRDRQDGDRRKRERLPAEEFITHSLPHVLPSRFTRVRHYGYLATRNKWRALDRIRGLIGAATPLAEPPLTLREWLIDILGNAPYRCPCCGNTLTEDLLPPDPGRLPVPGNSPSIQSAPREPP